MALIIVGVHYWRFGVPSCMTPNSIHHHLLLFNPWFNSFAIPHHQCLNNQSLEGYDILEPNGDNMQNIIMADNEMAAVQWDGSTLLWTVGNLANRWSSSPCLLPLSFTPSPWHPTLAGLIIYSRTYSMIHVMNTLKAVTIGPYKTWT